MAREKGFTLVEILIVVLILAIIAAIALPRFSNASATAKDSMLADDLRVIRSQITIFKFQHNDVAPGYPDCDRTQTPDQQSFVGQMTSASTDGGATAPPGTAGYPHGPYLGQMPVNPVNGIRAVLVVADNAAFPPASNQYGWVYQPSSLTFRADSNGIDQTGRPYSDY